MTGSQLFPERGGFNGHEVGSAWIWKGRVLRGVVQL